MSCDHADDGAPLTDTAPGYLLTPSTKLTGNSGGGTIRAVLRLTKDQVDTLLCERLDSRLADAGIARRDRPVWVDSACGTDAAEMYERWLEDTRPDPLEMQLEAQPLGATAYDRDNHELTRVPGGWTYTAALHQPGLSPRSSRETAGYYAPITLVSKGQTNA